MGKFLKSISKSKGNLSYNVSISLYSSGEEINLNTSAKIANSCKQKLFAIKAAISAYANIINKVK